MNMAVEHSSPLLGMWTENDKAVPLESIQVEAELALPVAITRQAQTYRNQLTTPIEARYVFPVPLDAVLLGLEIRIGERVLHGVVKPKDEAERNYESAIVKGDSAFLLTRLDDGLYQISLGNILPGERVELTVTWAETLRWNGQDIRYRLPNLVGEHYGNPQRAGIAPDVNPIAICEYRGNTGELNATFAILDTKRGLSQSRSSGANQHHQPDRRSAGAAV